MYAAEQPSLQTLHLVEKALVPPQGVFQGGKKNTKITQCIHKDEAVEDSVHSG